MGSSRSTRGRLSRTSGSAPRSPSSARSSCAASRYGAARKHRAGTISATPVCSRSAEPFYEPVVLAPARQNNRCGFERGASGAGRTLRCAEAPRPPPVTFVNGRSGDICIWWTQSGRFERRSTNQARNKAKGRTHDPPPRRRRFRDDPRAHGGVAPGACTGPGGTVGSTGAAARVSQAERAGDTHRAVACSDNVGESTLPGLTRETQTLALLIASERSAGASRCRRLEFVEDQSASFQSEDVPPGPRHSREQQRQRFSPGPLPRLRRQQLRSPLEQFPIGAGIRRAAVRSAVRPRSRPSSNGTIPTRVSVSYSLGSPPTCRASAATACRSTWSTDPEPPPASPCPSC